MPPPEKRRYRRNLPRQCSSLPPESMEIKLKLLFNNKICSTKHSRVADQMDSFQLGMGSTRNDWRFIDATQQVFLLLLSVLKATRFELTSFQAFSLILARNRILLLGRNRRPRRPLHSRTATFRSPNGRRRNQTKEHVNLGET